MLLPLAHAQLLPCGVINPSSDLSVHGVFAFCIMGRVSEMVIARLGRWNINVQHSNYVTDMPLTGLLAAAGHTGEGERVWR